MDTYQSFAPLKGEFRQTIMNVSQFKLNTAITTSCKNPELAFAVVDYMLSDEGWFLGFCGLEGVDYTWDERPSFIGTTPSINYNAAGDYTAHWQSGSFPRWDFKEFRYGITRDDAVSGNAWVLADAAKYEQYGIRDIFRCCFQLILTKLKIRRIIICVT